MRAVYERARDDASYDTGPAFKLAESIAYLADRAAPSRCDGAARGPGGATRDRRACYVRLCNDVGNLGYVRGEVLDVIEADGLKPGDAACASYGPDYATAGRVVTADARALTLRLDDASEVTFDRTRADLFAGRVVGLGPRHNAEDEERLAALRRRLVKIGADDITDSTARFQIESEIYRIEHRAGSGDLNWPEYIRG